MLNSAPEFGEFYNFLSIYYFLSYYKLINLPMMNKTIFIKILPQILLPVFFFGCSTIIPSESKLMRDTNTENITSYELRNRLNVFSIRFSNIVERAADEIINSTDDQKIRENALLWKMNSIPAANQAIFLSDPMAALIDISAFCLQMFYFLESGKGKDLFGDHQQIAITASDQLGKEVLRIWERARGQVIIDSIKIVTDPILKWAETYPVEDLSFIRRSVMDTLFSHLEYGEIGIQESVGSMAVSIYDMRERLTIYTEQLPKQARWQAEYALNKGFDNLNIKRSLENFERITNSIDSITRVIEQSPDLINSVQYRTMAKLTAERIALLDALKAERVALLAEVDLQRLQTIDVVESFTEKMLNQSETRIENLIDHFYWRLLYILILIYVVLLITFISLKKLFWPTPR